MCIHIYINIYLYIYIITYIYLCRASFNGGPTWCRFNIGNADWVGKCVFCRWYGDNEAEGSIKVYSMLDQAGSLQLCMGHESGGGGPPELSTLLHANLANGLWNTTPCGSAAQRETGSPPTYICSSVTTAAAAPGAEARPVPSACECFFLLFVASINSG